MRRNNENRTKSRRQQQQSVDPAALLDFVTPTEFVELPSKGIGYPSGHPLCDKETIEIRFMTAKDEDILTSRSLLKKGVALDRLIDNLLIDKTLRAKDIIVGDRNAIIIAARASAYGHIYETKVACPSCEHNQKHEFDLSEANIHEPILNDDIEELENGNYMVTTPFSKMKVELRLMTGHDEAVILKLMNKNKNDDNMLTSQMKLYIVSVNDHKQPEVISHFVNNVPAAEARYVRNIYQDIAPTIEIKGDFECESCGYEQELEVPFNADFFWPDR